MNHTGTNPPSNPKTKAVAVIPARYDSVRLPGKALLEIAGKPMICWVVERALAARNVSRAIVATDDERILEAVKVAGYEAVMTSVDHKSGTDRIAEVAASLADADIIVNLQGDEPLISPVTLDGAIDAIGEWGRGNGVWANGGTGEKGNGEGERDGVGIVTTWEPIESTAVVLNPDVVKIVVDEHERAVSRSPVPYRGTQRAAQFYRNRNVGRTWFVDNRKHTGLYLPPNRCAGVCALAAVGVRAVNRLSNCAHWSGVHVNQ